MRPLWLLAVLVASGCSGRHVLFERPIEQTRLPSVHRCPSGALVDTWDPAVVRVWFDRDGDLYPGHDVPPPLPDRVHGGDASRPLRDTYAPSVRPNVPAPEWSPVVAALGLGPEAPWTIVQDSVRARAARRIRNAAAGGGPIIVLVHGYNVDDADCDYASVRARLEAAAPEATRGATWLYVSWNGKRQTLPLVIWTHAQFHFPLVGQGLRRLVSHPAFPRDAPVRFLGHSSGNPVLAHALWDASAAEQVGADECEWPAYRAYLSERTAGRLALPRLRDARVGMIVPAGPESLFRFFDMAAPPVSRVVLGLNSADFAVAKGGTGCSGLGSSCLATRPSHACAVRDRFLGSQVEVAGWDFSGYRGPRAGMFWMENHDFDVYAIRPQFPAFARALLTDAPVSADDLTGLCRGVDPVPLRGGRRTPLDANRADVATCRAAGRSL